jgi:histidine ammonia-lyase
MSEPVYTLGASRLTVADVVRASRAPVRLALTAEARARMQAARAVVDRYLASETPAYGLNTGLGANVGYRIPSDAIPGFQEQLIRGRVIGVGDLLPAETCRAALFCRTAALAQGGAGISPDVHELMMAMLERDVTPAIPSRGSIGAGDLGLLTSIASVMIGRGQAFHAGRLLPGGDALAAAGLRPVALGAKDGLALANASAVTTAMASLALDAAREFLQVHVAVAAFACDGYAANPRIFDARLAAARPARGQESAAALFRRGMEGGSPHAAGSDRRVQDALCFRTLAQVTGTALAAFADARDAVETELNSAADNPLVLVEAGEIYSSANFHTPAIALAFDAFAIAMTYVATASAYRSIKLMTGRLTGLPDYLTPVGGPSAGLVPLQKTISALHAEVRLKAYPASLDAIPVSDAVEDVAPQTPLTIRKFGEQLDLLRWLTSIEALTAAEAWDLRRARAGAPIGRAQPGRAGRELHPIVRSAAAFLDEDRETGPDVTAVHEALWSEQAITAVDAIFRDVPSPIAVPQTGQRDDPTPARGSCTDQCS